MEIILLGQLSVTRLILSLAFSRPTWNTLISSFDVRSPLSRLAYGNERSAEEMHVSVNGSEVKYRDGRKGRAEIVL